MSRLADRVRRSLRASRGDSSVAEKPQPAPEGPSEVVSRLRRELARIDARYPKKLQNNGSVAPELRATHHYQLVSRKGAAPRSPRPRVIEPLEPGGAVFRHDFGQILALEGALEKLRPEGARVRLSPEESRWQRVEPLLVLDGAIEAPPTDLRATEVAFLDTETTGLSRGAGTVAFMIGVGRFVREGADLRLRVEQFVVDRLAREAEVLDEVATALEGARLMVTFNGRGFDAPIVESRALLNRSSLALPGAHLDLLPWARRLFGGRLDDCRLGTLEREVLGFGRLDDMPGSEAPAAYGRYLAQGDLEQLHGVLEHNLIDVATLVALLWRVGDVVTEPLHWAEDGEELYGVAKLWHRAGDSPLAEACLDRALALTQRSSDTRRRVISLLARLRRRRGDLAGAKALWQRYSEEFPRDDEGWIALAKHYEHVERDFAAALRAARRARDDFDGSLAHRLARLERRLEARVT